MNISRTKFVAFFLIFGFAFIFGTTSILNLPPDSYFGTENQERWQSTISTIVSPIKMVFLGPVEPFKFKDPDTPPPFFLALFASYWTILSLVLHYLLRKMKRPERVGGPAESQ